MIVLHAAFPHHQLLLWGETTPGTAMPPPRQRAILRQGGQRRSQPPVPLSPYDAGAEPLVEALRSAGCTFMGHIATVESAMVWLPTVNGQPVASTSLIADPPASRAMAVLCPWTVSVLPLTAEQAVVWLCACADKQTLAPGVVIGDDLQFWVTAMRWAAALVARQQFLPGLQQGAHPFAATRPQETAGEPYHARWAPVFAGADADRLAQMVRLMPHVCRALTTVASASPAPPSTPPEVPAVAVLVAFLGEMVDHLVRSSATPVRVGVQTRAAAPRQGRQTAPTFASLHDQWLHALRAPEGVMAGDAAELERFGAQMRDWQRPLAVTTATPFRLCFRLEEPTVDGARRGQGRAHDEPWQVQYLLQAADDPSLLIPAAEAWKTRGRAASMFARRRFGAREYVLASLGQVAGICPAVEASLRTATPDGYGLDATGAHEFLTGTAFMLEQAGFGVLLPSWWTRSGTKLRLAARAHVRSPRFKGSSGLSLDDLVRFEWTVALGDEPLSRAELAALARLKAPLVRLRGQWVQVSAEEIQAALDFWDKKGTGQATARDIVQMALGTGKSPVNMPFAGVTATGWMADLLGQLEGHTALAEIPVPEQFRGTLRPYQQRGYSWLAFLRRWGLGACLADDMGLGKTIQTLALIQRDWESSDRKPVLLICPTSVIGNWQKEAARFTPSLPVLVQHGSSRVRGPALKRAAQKHAVVISSYALLHRDVEVLKQVPWAGVILDEAQNIKNAETLQARAARELRADYRLALTGTPVENNVGDLWSILDFLNPGFLGSQSAFKRTFFVPIQAHRDPDAVQRLKRLTGPFILRRLKTDKAIIADLPEKLEMKVFCTLTKEQASLYAAVVDDTGEMLDSAEGIQRKGLILATLSKLKQVCNHPAQFLGDHSSIPRRSGKLTRITDMLEEVLAVGDHALIFSQFAEMGTILRKHLQETFGREVLFLHGAVPKRQRDHLVERFQHEADGPRLLILSLKAGGTGLNLTRANHVFHFDRWWNPAVENQATDRAFRIGQTKNVQVHKFLCVGTLEEKIDEMIERKQEVARGVVGAGENWLTELSTAELKDLFALRHEAVRE